MSSCIIVLISVSPVLAKNHWSTWSTWSSCIPKCGRGIHHRSRTCDKLTSAADGQNCIGQSVENKGCFTSCTVGGLWIDWTTWSSCSTSCGLGVHWRTRSCQTPAQQNSSQSCVGEEIQNKGCYGHSCQGDRSIELSSVVNSKTSFSTPKSATRFSSTRIITNSMKSTEKQHISRATSLALSTISTKKFPISSGPQKLTIDGLWTEWSKWSTCSTSCGFGVHWRSRSCQAPAQQTGGQSCVGEEIQNKGCYGHSCQKCPRSNLLVKLPMPKCARAKHVNEASIGKFSREETGRSTASSSVVNRKTPTTTPISTGRFSSARIMTQSMKSTIRQRTSGTQSLAASTISRIRSPTPSVPLTLTSMKVASALSTVKRSTNVPQKAIKCAQCMGPPEACELAYFIDVCQPPNQYCINHVINLASGEKRVERKCGNFEMCYKDWYLGTSDDDKCLQLSSSNVLNYQFECTYCCTHDECNIDLRPPSNTLYSNTV